MLRPDLARMALQIAANYRHHGPERAAEEVAGHLRRFWTPAIRAELIAADRTLAPTDTDAAHGDELDEIVRRGAALLAVPGGLAGE